MRYLFITLFFLLKSKVDCDFTTEYYENLINQKTSEAQTFQLPESNEEFKAGEASDNVTEFGIYDFIIVGAGSSGSVLATRLSEITDWNILLLEAGGEEDDFNAIPAMSVYLQFSEKNWGYLSTPQTSCCLGMKEKKCMAPRGKSIGGSSAINSLLYVRGNPKDFDKWEEQGNPGWSFEEILPYFIKSENSQINGDPGFHGKGGFWNVEYGLPYSDPFSYFIQGNKELNVSEIDYNGINEIGVSRSQINIKHGRRQSTGTAFLDNARQRKNLKVITKALVTKVIIDESTKTAEGVIFVTNDSKFSVKARKEVILSAGAYNSPQILMLSGIGPENHLKEMGITVIQDLPVGKNLIEHPLFQGLTFRTNFTYTQPNMQEVIEQFLQGFGPFTFPSNVEGIGFTVSVNSTPTIEYIFIPPAGGETDILGRMYNWDDKLINSYLSNINLETDFTFYLILLHEKSRGRVTLKSNNPLDFPNVNLNLFSDPEDVENYIEGIEFVLKLAETDAFRKINATLLDIPICQEFEKYSHSFWNCTIRNMAQTIYHPCGTTKMGPDSSSSVVDNKLKVHGIEKLRVVDAGVIPLSISGHTNAAAVMIAEKISDVIKKDHPITN